MRMSPEGDGPVALGSEAGTCAGTPVRMASSCAFSCDGAEQDGDECDECTGGPKGPEASPGMVSVGYDPRGANSSVWGSGCLSGSDIDEEEAGTGLGGSCAPLTMPRILDLGGSAAMERPKNSNAARGPSSPVRLRRDAPNSGGPDSMDTVPFSVRMQDFSHTKPQVQVQQGTCMVHQKAGAKSRTVSFRDDVSRPAPLNPPGVSHEHAIEALSPVLSHQAVVVVARTAVVAAPDAATGRQQGSSSSSSSSAGAPGRRGRPGPSAQGGSPRQEEARHGTLEHVLRRHPSDVQLAPSRSFDEAGDEAEEAFEGHAGDVGVGEEAGESKRSLARMGSILQGLRLDDVRTGENRGRSTHRKGRSGQGAGKARKLPSASPLASPTGMNSLPSASPTGGDASEESAWGHGWIASLGRMSQDSLHSGGSRGSLRSKPAAATSRSKLGSSSSSSSRSIGRRDRPGSATGSISGGSPDLGLNIDSSTCGPLDSPARAAGDSPVEQAASKGKGKGGALARVSSAVRRAASSSQDTRAGWMSPVGGQHSDGGSVLETEEGEAAVELAELMARQSIKRSRSDFEMGGQVPVERRWKGVGMDQVAPPQACNIDRASKRPRLVRGASHEVLPSLGQEG